MIEGAIQNVEYDLVNNRTDILLWIRTDEDSRKMVRVRKPFLPYFYTTRKPTSLPSINNYEKTDKTAIYSPDETVWKVETRRPGDVADAREKLRPHYEADILFPQRYLIDSELKYGIRINDNKEIEPIDTNIEPKLMYIDIETPDMTGVDRIEEAPGEIVLIGAYIPSLGKEKYFILNHPDLDETDNMEIFQSERELIESFIDYVNDEDPDVLIGKYFTSFDMPYLMHRSKKIDVDFSRISPVGRIRDETHGFKVAGRSVLDWEDYYERKKETKPESHRLQDILEDELEWDKVEVEDFGECWRNDPNRLVKKNHSDIVGPAKIDEKMNIIRFFNELRKIVGCRLKDTRFMGKLADFYYLRHLKDTKWVAPSKNAFSSNKRGYSGAAVLDPKKGRWEHVVVIDLASAYPSLMRTFNVSPETLIDEKDKGKYPYLEMQEATFRTDQKGIIPSIEETLLERRNKKKELMKQAENDEEEEKYFLEQYAIKVLGNSYYGTLGDIKSRYFKYVIAEGITSIIKEIIITVGKELENLGFSVVGGDSVREDTPIIIKEDGKIKILPINDLFIAPKTNTRQKCIPKRNIKVLTKNGWSEVKGLYRHKTNKKMYGITTREGYIECTEDHSLIINDNEIKPSELNIGDKLNLIDYPELEEDEFDSDLAWLIGFFLAEGSNGRYKTKYGDKTQWKIDNQNTELLEKSKDILRSKLGVESKIEDYRESSNIYRLSPRGNGTILLNNLFNKWCRTKMGKKKVPEFIINSNSKKEFLNGIMAGDGYVNSKNQIEISLTNKTLMQGIIAILKSYGVSYNIRNRKDKPNVLRFREVMDESNSGIDKDEIKDIREFNINEYVYDIETDNNEFSGGPGNIRLHNTDSTFVQTPEDQDLDELVAMANEIIDNYMLEEYGVSDHQIKMDLDKIYDALIIREKKLYAGKLQSGEIKKKGIASRRSDTASLVKELQEKMLKLMLDGESKESISNYLRWKVGAIKAGKYGLTKLGVPTKFKKAPEGYDKTRMRNKINRRARKYLDIEFSRGDKPKRVICKTIGLIGGWNDSDLGDLEIDYHKMIDKYVRPKIEPFLELYEMSWSEIEGQKDITDFF